MIVNSPNDFEYLSISLASPDRIRYWSYGEVEKPETINYRTFKPERRGLFCEKIFGPVKDWECSCGKYRRVRYRGIVCERCGVEVTHSKVRRERMGHLELAADVAHIWFLKGIPSYLGLLLDMTSRELEEVVYYDSYIVTSVDSSISEDLNMRQVLSINEYMEFKEKYGSKFSAGMGASAIKEILAGLELGKLIKKLREESTEVKGQKKLKLTKRLRVVESLHKSSNKPEWMILEAIPIMPPDLRPMVQLEGGRFATSDLNDLYRRVVNRNNRLKRLMDIGAPEMIIRNEKRMLQESVDVLISNGKRGRSVTGSNGRPLKSLGNIIEGKQGRFRQNLLGKRVDYSARSVIVVGPHLKFHQCGLPKEMVLELFKPFVIRKLVQDGIVSNVKSAKRKIEKREVEVWDALESVIKGQLVLLNRAPTLHRLGIQAFEPILVEGSAIQIHPLVCSAFNADFDGDQMAVHLPLSVEAQSECRLLISSTNNILSPSSGKSIVTPTQDMILGCYFLTVEDPDKVDDAVKCFINIEEAWRAWENKSIVYHSNIEVYINDKRVKTTMGRVIMNTAIWDIFEKHNLPKEDFLNQVMGKKRLSEMVYDYYIKYGNEITSDIIDRLKRIGFRYSTLSGISISIDDMVIPSKKPTIIKEAREHISKLDQMVKRGSLSESERIIMGNEIWRGATKSVSDSLESELGELNNVFIMANSGARGNIDQVRQLSGMRGLMSDAQGRTVNIPIISSFKEGLTLTEYFISCYGARKGLVDTALRTADSGYLTRRLVDVAQDVTVTIEDCGTKEGVDISSIKDGTDVIVSLSEQVVGRYVNSTVKDSEGNIIVKANTYVDKEIAKKIEDSGVTFVNVRSVFTCESERGLCQKCYGLDLGTARLVNLGEAVGIIAAQSIGEPGTQLTMRTFHTGGVDLRGASLLQFNAKLTGKVEFDPDILVSKVTHSSGETWIVTQESYLKVKTDKKEQDIILSKGSKLFVKNKQSVSTGDKIAEYDPSINYLVSDIDGSVKYIGIKVKTETDESSKVVQKVAETDGEIFVFDKSDEKSYYVSKTVASKFEESKKVGRGDDFGSSNSIESGGIITCIQENKDAVGKKDMFEIKVLHGFSYKVFANSILYVSDGTNIKMGDILLQERTYGDASTTKDIVQGLPRVEELFEARKPKIPAVLSALDGHVEITDAENTRILTVYGKDDTKVDYKVSYNTRLNVYSGKDISKGEQLTVGIPDPHDIMATQGVTRMQTYLAAEVQRVYRSQGVGISTKHVEVIIRQMTRKVAILEMGDSSFLPNELIDIRLFNQTNAQLKSDGKEPAVGQRILLGITRASLNNESFISASSFQQTATVLTKAAIEGQTDPMKGLKENVIIGKLIPAGTGLNSLGNVSVKLSKDESDLQEDVLEKEIS